MFKVGQRVICIVKGDGWYLPDHNGKFNGPVKDEELIINDIYNQYDYVFLIFNKYHKTKGFESSCFRPLHDETVENIIKQVKPKPKPHLIPVSPE